MVGRWKNADGETGEETQERGRYIQENTIEDSALFTGRRGDGRRLFAEAQNERKRTKQRRGRQARLEANEERTDRSFAAVARGEINENARGPRDASDTKQEAGAGKKRLRKETGETRRKPFWHNETQERRTERPHRKEERLENQRDGTGK